MSELHLQTQKRWQLEALVRNSLFSNSNMSNMDAVDTTVYLEEVSAVNKYVNV